MKNINPEILAPAGDFNTAIHALNSGADAVYLGLLNFSARKTAANFNLDELRRLKSFTTQNNKKIYVAINTVIHESEIHELIETLIELDELKVDGIIVQDLGAARIIKQYTNLELHASTQLAVHNKHGVLALQDLGFSRVVLSRELKLNEIKSLREEFPQMEFEVFIHGALCYGFSGLCLASSKILNRSGNRGECGQICRSWFNSGKDKKYFFSLNDVNIDENVLKLKEIGIDSLKIEGRLKSPSYASTVSSMYYKILNNKDYNREKESSKIEFSRSGDNGYLLSQSGGASINVNYPGHLGSYIGNIVENGNKYIKVKLNNGKTIENRDGLLVLTSNTPPEPVKFTTTVSKTDKDTVTLIADLPKNINKEVFLISEHNKYLKNITSSQYKPYKIFKKLEILIAENNLTLISDGFKFCFENLTQESLKESDYKSQLIKVFQHGGETNYSFNIKIVNKTNFSTPFLPVSSLKRIRNEFLISYNQDQYERKIQKVKVIEDSINTNLKMMDYIKNREELPFIINFNDTKIENLEKLDNNILLPLSPVIFDSHDYLNKLQNFLSENSDKHFIIGLNNISHLSFIKHLPKDQKYYCDYALYICNNFAKAFIEEIPNICWGTNWVEDSENEIYPPIFISRTCFKNKENGCPKNCNKSFDYEVSQQNSRYKILVRDCMTYTLST